MELLTNNINPRLLKIGYFNSYNHPQPMKMSQRMCYDYEIEYFLKSEGGIIVDGEYIRFKAGQINIRKPGQIVCGVVPYECYTICISVNGYVKKTDDYVFGCPQNAQAQYDNALISDLPNKLILNKSEYIYSIIKDIFLTSQQKSEFSNFKNNTLLYNLLLELFNQNNNANINDSIHNKHIVKAVDYIKDNFCKDINIANIIEKSSMSKAYFHKCFKAYAKSTPMAMIISLRIEKAKTLLCMTDNSISDISLFCGYYDNVYFSHLFKKNTGLTPTQYRENYTSQ